MEKKDVFETISKNPVSLIQDFECLEIYLEKNHKVNIFCVKNTDLEVMISYHENKGKIQVGYCLEDSKNISKKNKITYCSAEFMKNFLIDAIKEKKDAYDFCSLIIIDKFDYDRIINTIIINLWIKLYKISNSRPYLCFLTYSDVIPDVPFKLSDENIFKLSDENKNIGIIYNDKSYKLSDKKLYLDMFQKIKDLNLLNPIDKTKFSTWVIFCSDKNQRRKISNLMYNFSKDNGEVFTLFSDLKYKTISNIMRTSKRGFRKFLIFDDSLDIPKCIKNIDGIFDCMTTNFLIKSEEINSYISKNKSESRLKCLNEGFYFRMCTKSFYEHLATVEIEESCKIYMDKIYLNTIINDMNPFEVFSSRISKKTLHNSLDNLEKLSLLVKETETKYNVTEKGRIVTNLPFSIKQNIIIKEWIDSKNDILPIIILTSILETNKPLFYNKKSNTEFESPDTLTYILQIFLTFIKKFNIIHIRDQEIKNHCKENNLNYNSMISIFEKIKRIYNILSKDYEIFLNIFDIHKFSKDCIKIYEKVYFNETYRLINPDKKIYSNGFNNICTLDTEKFYNPNFEAPSKIIALLYTKINTSKDSVQRRKTMISLFLKSE